MVREPIPDRTASPTAKRRKTTMARTARRPRVGAIFILTAMTLLAAGGLAELAGADRGSGPPRSDTSDVGGRPAARTATHASMAYSVPVHIDIPAVNVHADLIKVDANPDGSLGTPPLDNAKVAAWYDGSFTPGQAGVSIIDAHVDSARMKDYRGAFFFLALAKPGMEVDVTRTDHSVAVFIIDEVQETLKTQFPTDKVYGDTTYPSLRLITCGGDFDRESHQYLGNTIVYAHLAVGRAGTKPASTSVSDSSPSSAPNPGAT